MDNQKKNYFFIPEDETGKFNEEDMYIYQYMRLDYLFNLLETKKYYAKKRCTFEDANESKFNLKDYFASRFIEKLSEKEKIVREQTQENDSYLTFKEAKEIPVSCWTKKNEESYMMWKVYANEMGVRIKSSVLSFIDSIKLDHHLESENQIICGNVRYEHTLYKNEVTGVLFDKYKHYSDEEEFRFYLNFNEIINNDKEFILFDVDIEIMVHEIMFSPFISEEAAKVFTEIIKERYKITNVKQSNIKLK
jgi:hypothetical protein